MTTKTTSTLLLAVLLGCASKSGETPASEAPSSSATPETTAAEVPSPKPVEPIPEGWFALTPQLVVADVAAAVAFYEQAFAAKRLNLIEDPEGKALHAELGIGDSIVLIDREGPRTRSPLTLGGTPLTLMLYVPNVDAVFEAAVAAGGKVELPVDVQFWGDRYGQLVDPSGHRWGLGTHVEDLTDEQTRRRAELLFADLAAAKAEAEKAAKAKKKQGKKKAEAAPGEEPPGEPSWTSIVGTPATQAVPSGYHTLTIGLTVNDAAAALAFYTSAYGATEITRLPGEDGKIAHAEVKIGDTVLMLSDEVAGDPTSTSAAKLGGSPALVHHYVLDTDGTFAKAIAAGATKIVDPMDAFWGDRYAAVVDVAGIPWGIGTHVEDVSPEEIAERSKKALTSPP